MKIKFENNIIKPEILKSLYTISILYTYTYKLYNLYRHRHIVYYDLNSKQFMNVINCCDNKLSSIVPVKTITSNIITTYSYVLLQNITLILYDSSTS